MWLKNFLQLLLLGTACLVFACASASAEEFSPDALEFFEKDVRPLLSAKCYSCHGRGDKLEAGLDLTKRAAILRGGDNGAAAIPAKPADSLLIKVVRYEGEIKMPPDGRLNDEQVAVLTRWVERGLPWPKEDPSAAAATANTSRNYAEITEVQRRHWSFQPIQSRAANLQANNPQAHHGQAKTSAWPQSNIDAYILAELGKHGLQPSPPADRRTWLRRVTLDLIGLPPTADETCDFLADQSPAAIANVVDRLLASPHYGEKWARHWLDVARYADSSGKDENHACANAFRYRDFVVQSFNRDKPFDRFVRQQIAGDLLPATDPVERYENIIATGLLQLGPKALAEQDKQKLMMDIADEQLDTVNRAFLGLTASCGRCHDHKLEPIPQRDYYALAGIFRSTRTMQDLAFVSNWLETPLADAETLQRSEEHRKQLEQIEKEIKDAAGKGPEVLKPLEKKRDDLKAASPPAIPHAMAVQEGDIADLAINIRGNHLNLGNRVPRGFLQIISLPNTPSISAGQSGRLQLAEWLTRPDHPLTARVIANRVWQWHFGQGLVATADNFGLSGARPSHPELLDYLASRLIENGWSLKSLHREILLSGTYQMSCTSDAASTTIDPDNRWRWRFDRRRLTAEELRDAWLAVSGQLDRQVGGNLFNYVNREPHVTYYKGPVKYDFPRRSLYLPVVRNAMLDLFDLFDHGDALTSLGKRNETTVATQSLYLLNSELVLAAAGKVIDQMNESFKNTAPNGAPGNTTGNSNVSPRDRIVRAYQIILNRLPDDVEIARSEKFLSDLEAKLVKSQADATARQRLAWQAFCQTLLVSNEFMSVE